MLKLNQGQSGVVIRKLNQFGFWKWNISVSHKIKKWPQLHKYTSYGKVSNYHPPQSLGLWFSECWRKWNISINHYTKIKKWLPFCKYASYGKMSNYWPPPKFRSLVFHVLTETEYQSQPLWKNWKKWLPFCKYALYRKISNYWLPPLQSLSLCFSECWPKWNIGINHYEKIEKWPPFHKYALYGKISNYWSPQVWVSGFPSVNRNRITVLAIVKK